jgi:hypothetical protein
MRGGIPLVGGMFEKGSSFARGASRGGVGRGGVAWGVGASRGAWGASRGAWGASRGAWGVGRGASRGGFEALAVTIGTLGTL